MRPNTETTLRKLNEHLYASNEEREDKKQYQEEILKLKEEFNRESSYCTELIRQIKSNNRVGLTPSQTENNLEIAIRL